MDRLFRIDFYPQDWLTQTSNMTLEQRGLFIQVISMIYANRGAIENDAAWIGRAANCSARLARSLINQLVEKDSLQIQGSKITQKRCEHELNLKRTHLELSAKGGRTRAEKERISNENKDITSTDETDSVSSSTPSPSPSPSPKEDIRVEEATKIFPTEIGVYFEEFWRVYPKQEGRITAIAAYRKAREEGTDHAAIVAGAKRYAEYSKGTAQRYLIPPDKWLAGGHWSDEYRDSNAAKPANRKPAYADSIKSAVGAALDNIRTQDEIRAQSKQG